MNKNEIVKIVRSEINDYFKNELDSKMKTILKTQNSQSREELIRTIANSLEAVYKVMWQKRDFWKDLR